MIVYFIHLSLSYGLNAISFLFPIKTVNEGCFPQAFLHLISLTFTLNVILIYYILSYLIVIEWDKIGTFFFQFMMYLVNWITLIFFLIFFVNATTTIETLNTCRFKVKFENWITIVNTIYSFVVIIMTCYVYRLIRKKLVTIAQNPFEQKKVKNIVIGFTVILFFLIVKTISYILKICNLSLSPGIIDRIMENIMFLSCFILFGIGLTNLDGFCCIKKNTITQNEPLTYEEEENVL
jgi:hypothetical protein